MLDEVLHDIVLIIAVRTTDDIVSKIEFDMVVLILFGPCGSGSLHWAQHRSDLLFITARKL